MNVPGEGWFVIDSAAIGIDPEQFTELITNRGLIDLEAFTDGLDLTDLGEDEVDGDTYRRLHGTADPAAVFNALPEGFISDPMLAEAAAEIVKSMEMDIWIDEETLLMRRMEMTIEMEIPEAGSGEMTMTMDMVSYNEPVDIPARPANARPISQLTP
jgi:hypothetical protein